MRLDRFTNESKLGKYALLKLRRLDDFRSGTFQELAEPIASAIKTLEKAGILDWGEAETESEFFVIRLKDKFARPALVTYALEAERWGEWEYGEDVRDMARRAGDNNKWCKKPD